MKMIAHIDTLRPVTQRVSWLRPPANAVIWMGLMVLVVLGSGYGLSKIKPQEQHLLSSEQFSERHGLRVLLVGVTAAGGLVDFRFRVLDAEKANQFLRVPQNLPQLAVPGKATRLQPPRETLINASFENDQVYYFLYSNIGGLIKPGGPVIVIFGDEQLEPILAK